MGPGAENIVLLFLKYPTAGKVKTRLAARIGRENAMRLYESFVYDILGTLKQSGFLFRICFHPPDAGPAIAGWLTEPHFQFAPQKGDDLGARMKNAFMDAFAKGYENVLLVGSDIPDLPAGFFHEAFRSLLDHDVVVGPSKDGGYYLIGFRKTGFTADAFADISWSSRQVRERTLQILKGNGLSVHLLPILQDIDEVSDLADFIWRYEKKQNNGIAPCTRSVLGRIRKLMEPGNTS